MSPSPREPRVADINAPSPSAPTPPPRHEPVKMLAADNSGTVRVLLVDDNPGNLDVLEAMLEVSGCTLVRALSADEALLALLQHEFAAMILDIRMPGVSGIELARLIKQRKRTQHVPILFLTAHLVDERDILLGYGAGAVDYLSKPINPAILRSKVEVFIALYRKTQELARVNEALRLEILERMRVQAALEDANQALELRVQERTAALTAILTSERQAKEEAQRQSRIKDEFVATLSHELRTPMNIILGWIKLLAAGMPLTNARQAIETIRRNARLQAKLIEDLLDMNRLAAGNLHLEMTAVDVAEVVHASARELRPIAAAGGVHLEIDVHRNVGSIVADAARLQQILWNLLNNAIKFNRPGGHVHVRVTSTGPAVEIAIEDNGRGISAEFLPHVFERFRQSDSSTTREAGGLGLGLSITKQLVDLHGGTIEASSPGEGLGSTFVLRLPARPQQTIDVDETGSAQASGSPRHVDAATGRGAAL